MAVRLISRNVRHFVKVKGLRRMRASQRKFHCLRMELLKSVAPTSRKAGIFYRGGAEERGESWIERQWVRNSPAGVDCGAGRDQIIVSAGLAGYDRWLAARFSLPPVRSRILAFPTSEHS